MQEPLYLDEFGAESEEDARPLDMNAVRRAYITGADWTVETLLGQLRRGNIDLNPKFQRRDAWNLEKKSRFIESILLNLPIPQLVLAERPEQPNTFLVLDGKQRLLSLRQFCSDPELVQGDSAFPVLQLHGLTVRTDLNGTTYRQLQDNPQLGADRTAFENHTIRTVVIRHWPDNDFLFRVFLRLNTGSVALSPQELRQALLPGPFVDFADDYASDADFPLRRALGLEKPDFRMRDTEVLVRYFAFRNRIDEYRGNLKAFLDTSCDYFNRNWSDIEDQIKAQSLALEAAVVATESIFTARYAFVRYRGVDTEQRFNRAVFDVMAYYLSSPQIRSDALQYPDAVRDAFFSLSLNDDEFDRSLSTTTKSTRSTAYRFVKWAEALDEVIPTKVSAPKSQVNALKG